MQYTRRSCGFHLVTQSARRSDTHHRTEYGLIIDPSLYAHSTGHVEDLVAQVSVVHEELKVLSLVECLKKADTQSKGAPTTRPADMRSVRKSQGKLQLHAPLTQKNSLGHPPISPNRPPSNLTYPLHNPKRDHADVLAHIFEGGIGRQTRKRMDVVTQAVESRWWEEFGKMAPCVKATSTSVHGPLLTGPMDNRPVTKQMLLPTSSKPFSSFRSIARPSERLSCRYPNSHQPSPNQGLLKTTFSTPVEAGCMSDDASMSPMEVRGCRKLLISTRGAQTGLPNAASVQSMDTPSTDYADKSAAGSTSRGVDLAASPTTNTHHQRCIQRTTTVISEYREAARMPKETLKARIVNMEIRRTVVTPRRLRLPGDSVIHILSSPWASSRTLAGLHARDSTSRSLLASGIWPHFTASSTSSMQLNHTLRPPGLFNHTQHPETQIPAVLVLGGESFATFFSARGRIATKMSVVVATWN
ncbi:hypothetical protein ARMSODRAFT_980569 [Armillaria solidipes]|uniref:Uncharacterized protein n=1 Tax=Armillaria solidipes TaxID=1076256 RepID=A0A2H3AUU6_9AGAR|nr:hypothetical protein ARMSODRAFT_980569 [Armillaria solidipes]